VIVNMTTPMKNIRISKIIPQKVFTTGEKNTNTTTNRSE